MRIFEQIDNYQFRLLKKEWSEEDKLSAICIGLKEESDLSFIGDVRYTRPEALKKFLYHVFTHVYAHENQAKKKIIFSLLNSMYKKYRKEIRESFIDKVKYDRDLYKHQSNSLIEMLYNQFNFLSFEMGLGKTITSATLSRILKVKRTIIVAPAGVKWNWYHDMTDDWGYNPLYWTILDADKRKCTYAFLERFVVVNYEIIDKHFKHLSRADVGHIIIDECHQIKNHKTGRYKKVEKLVNQFPKARVTLLTGTPVTNRLNDLFAYFKLANHTLGNNMSYFNSRYLERSNGHRGKIIGAKNVDELSMRISNFMIRKKTEECLDLPDLITNKYYMEETEISQEYKDLLAEMYQQRMEAEEDNEEGIKHLENLITNVHSLNRILATSKAKRIIELADRIISEGRKVIIFSTYVNALKAIESHYQEKCVKIDGSVGSHKRSLLIEKFKSKSYCKVFLGNVKAAGVGINLVNASDVIFMNFPFTPDDIEQPQKRAHRIGQKLKVNVYYTIVKNSIDEHIYYNIISDKSRDINNLLDKGKKGVIDYSKVEGKIFDDLLNQYAKENNLKQINHGKKFETV